MPDDSTRLAVLIDADNTSPKLIKEMFEELAGYGTFTLDANRWAYVASTRQCSPT